MPVDFLLAPAASGKTQHAVRRVHALLKAEPLAPVLVILPNQFHVSEFRCRLAATGGVLGGEFYTFSALYAHLLACAGGLLPRLPDPVQTRLLRKIIDDLCDQGVMRHYAPLRTRPGFVGALRSMIQELKQGRIFPENFAAAVHGLGPRLEELGAVYNAYQDWLRRENWADAEGQGWLAAIALEENPSLGRELRLLAVNGFDEFNPTQLGVLELLVGRAQETLITFTGQPGLSRPAHRRFQRSLDLLAGALPGRLTLCPLDFAVQRPAPLAYLESSLFERRAAESPAMGAQNDEMYRNVVEFIEAQSRAAEARAALRWVKARLVRDGLQAAEIAILGRDIEVYRPFLEETAVEFALPLRIAGGLPLAENPAVVALLSLLALPACDWPSRPVVEAWRSPYFDWSHEQIEPADAASLDALARQGQVIAGLEQWRQAFDLLEQQKVDADISDNDEDALPSGVEAEVSRTLRGKFDAFLARLSPPQRGSLRDYVAYVEDLIGDDPALASRFAHLDGVGDDSLHIVARARSNIGTAERDVAALRALKDVLRGLVLAEAAVGDASPGAEHGFVPFFKDLSGAVQSASYYPPAEAGILTCSVLQARGLSFKAVVILGLSEGEFPRLEREDMLLWESDREILRQRGIPVPSKLVNDEASFFYQAVTRSSQRLLLTRPYLAEDGQPWEPSPYWIESFRLLGGPPVQIVRPEAPLAIQEAASIAEYVLASLAVGQYGRAYQLNSHLRRGVEVLRTRLKNTVAGIYEGDASELAEMLAAQFGPAHGWSASRLEAYGVCPFFFYIGHVLDLEPRTLPEAGYDVRMLGSMLHQILENTYRQAQNAADVEACLTLLPEVARRVFATAPADYGFRPTPLWALQQEELLRILQQTVAALAEVSLGYTPRYFEQRFGLGSVPLVLETEAGPIRLHGFIDRIDVAADGSLRVMDYKAGGAAITAKDLSEGRRLQLPIYALAARDALGLGEISGGFYWHIQKAEASQLKLERYDGGVQAAFDIAQDHITRHVLSIRSGQFQPQPPPGGCPHYCPASSFCWRYHPKAF